MEKRRCYLYAIKRYFSARTTHFQSQSYISFHQVGAQMQKKNHRRAAADGEKRP